jgi:large subunit ribosomal protein L4
MDKQTTDNQSKSSLTAVAVTDFADIKVKTTLLRQVLVGLQANQHRSTADVKTRGQVRGGGKKPWRQKGTGRARVGSSRTPVWRSGGIVFGPSVEKNYSHTLPTALKLHAMRSALAIKSKAERLHTATLATPPATTKAALLALPDLLALSRVLLIVPDSTFSKAYRNLDNVSVKTIGQVNVLDIMNHAHTVFVNDTYTQMKSKLDK